MEKVVMMQREAQLFLCRKKIKLTSIYGAQRRAAPHSMHEVGRATQDQLQHQCLGAGSRAVEETPE